MIITPISIIVIVIVIVVITIMIAIVVFILMVFIMIGRQTFRVSGYWRVSIAKIIPKPEVRLQKMLT